VKEQIDPLKPKRIKALTRKCDDELLVYDERRHKAHCLNKTAAMVWRECTGDCTVPEISKKLDTDFQSGGDDSLVRLAVARLYRAGLLEKSGMVHAELLSRREVLNRGRAIAMVAIPLVTTMLVPTPARAASCFPLSHLCNSNTQCCSGHCGVVLGLGTVCLP
jgi:hypothetical protein